MDLTYLGTATLLVQHEGRRLLTDPAFDPRGARYDFGPWYTPRSWFSSEKTEDPAASVQSIGSIDAVLLSHDHHADNLDLTGRALLCERRVTRVVTTRAGARRLARPRRMAGDRPGEGLGIGAKTVGLAWGERFDEFETFVITATPALHGPKGLPQVEEVNGFLLEMRGAPTIWFTGDTVAFPELDRFVEEHRGRVDVVVVHCGGVRFPRAPMIGDKPFTFSGPEAVRVLEMLEPRVVVPVHHSGWSHFVEPHDALVHAFSRSYLASRTRWLAPGEKLAL